MFRGPSRRHVLWALAVGLACLLPAAHGEFGFYPSAHQRDDARRAAEEAARRIDFAVKDPNLLGRIYADGGAALKARYTFEQFRARIEAARRPFGVAVTRSFRGIDGGFTGLPNIIRGNYVIVRFRSVFPGRSDESSEQITLQLSPDRPDDWRFVEFFVGPVDYDVQ